MKKWRVVFRLPSANGISFVDAETPQDAAEKVALKHEVIEIHSVTEESNESHFYEMPKWRAQ